MAAQNARSRDPAVLDGIVRRIVQVAQPDKIILFGSAARGQMGPHSDVDLLVVKAGKYHKWELALQIPRGIGDVGEPIDVIVATPGDLEQYGGCSALIYYPALQEGEVVYGP